MKSRANYKERIESAVSLAARFHGCGGHHEEWLVDQMVRALLGSDAEYEKFVDEACEGEDGPDSYSWEIGVAP